MRWLVILQCMQQDAARPSNKAISQNAAHPTPDATLHCYAQLRAQRTIITCIRFVLHGYKAAVAVRDTWCCVTIATRLGSTLAFDKNA